MLTYIGQMLGRHLGRADRSGTKGNAWSPWGTAESCFPLVKLMEPSQLPLPSLRSPLLLHPSLLFSLPPSSFPPPQPPHLPAPSDFVLRLRRWQQRASEVDLEPSQSLITKLFPGATGPETQPVWELYWGGPEGHSYLSESVS